MLDQVDAPADLKDLSRSELVQLCGKIREQLLVFLRAHGGHVGSNLAMVEATVAPHYVFNSPRDKIVFDVSHQCYTHKLLTGRKAAYTDPAAYGSAMRVLSFGAKRELVDWTPQDEQYERYGLTAEKLVSIIMETLKKRTFALLTALVAAALSAPPWGPMWRTCPTRSPSGCKSWDCRTDPFLEPEHPCKNADQI